LSDAFARCILIQDVVTNQSICSFHWA